MIMQLFSNNKKCNSINRLGYEQSNEGYILNSAEDLYNSPTELALRILLGEVKSTFHQYIFAVVARSTFY